MSIYIVCGRQRTTTHLIYKMRPLSSVKLAIK